MVLNLKGELYMWETVLIVLLFFILFVVSIYLVYEAIEECQSAGLATCAIVASIISLVSGVTFVHDRKISNIKNNQYNYQIQYNDTRYYTNDYILSNGGIEFEAEEGHFILPIEEQELKIKKTKKGGQ